MIKLATPTKDKRRARAAKKKAAEGAPTPKPEWAEAFMILLLHKTGGSLTVSVADLERFERLKANKKTQISFDPENQTVTITAPEMKLPKVIEVPRPDIITEIG